MSEPKRKRFWIDQPLQLRVLLFVLSLLAAALALAYLSMDRGLLEASERSRRLFLPVDWARESLRQPFLFTGAIVMVGGALLTLLWSHRIIGPLLVLMAGLRRIRDGNLKVDIRVRDSDALHRAVEDFSAMQASLRKKISEDRERVAAVDERLAGLAERLRHEHGARRELESIRDELRKITASFHL